MNTELIRGSGNLYRDFGRPDAMLQQARAIFAAKIIRVLDERKLTTRAAEELTGVGHSEFSRIRNAQLRRFTLDRLIFIISKLDSNVEFDMVVRSRSKSSFHAE